MAVQHRKQLSRLNIPSPSPFDAPLIHSAALTQANPMALYPPALATAIQSTFPNPFSLAAPLHTQLPPGTPSQNRHRQSASVAHLFGGMFPHPSASPHPNPFLPLSGHQPGGAGHTPKSKRNASISIGGPPKAVLGGPQRKLSPLPSVLPDDAAPAAATETRSSVKKPIVHLPEETRPIVYEGKPYAVPPWARKPLAQTVIELPLPQAPQISTAVEFPDREVQGTFSEEAEVFLPQHNAWDEYQRIATDEEYRALSRSDTGEFLSAPSPDESISSPADPALLAFKLNKLRNFQANTELASLTDISARDTFDNSSHQFQDANSDSQYLMTAWTPDRTLSFSSESDVNSRPLSRRDYLRGFGLDVTEEEGEEEVEASSFGMQPAPAFQPGQDLQALSEAAHDTDEDGATTAAPTRIHSRHTSQSAAAAINSLVTRRLEGVAARNFQHDPSSSGHEAVPAQQSLEETESLGGYSNPSDDDQVKRVDEFPRQRGGKERQALMALNSFVDPRTGYESVDARDGTSDDVISNPSDEGMGDDRGTFIHETSHQSRISQSMIDTGRDHLNPLAPPFVFGAPTNVSTHQETQSPLARHGLNAYAREFRPVGFPQTLQHNAPVSVSEPPQGVDHANDERGSSLMEEVHRADHLEQALRHQESKAQVTPPTGLFNKLNITAQPFVPTFILQNGTARVEAHSRTPSPEGSFARLQEVGIISQGDLTNLEAESDEGQLGLRLPRDRPVLANIPPLIRSFEREEEEAARERVPFHSRKPSLDNVHVTPIARSTPAQRTRTDSRSDAFVTSTKSEINSLHYAASFDGRVLGKELLDALEHYEQRLEDLLDDKMELLRRDVLEATWANNSLPSDKLERLLTMDDRTTNTSSNFPTFVGRSNSAEESAHLSTTLGPVLQQYLDPVSKICAENLLRLGDIEKDLKIILFSEVEKMGTHISARIQHLLSEMMDVNHLIAQLSSAVRPQIHELIDLASDKKETAALIIGELTPLLQAIQTDSLSSREQDILSAILTAMKQSNHDLTRDISHRVTSEIAPLVNSQYEATSAAILSRQVSGFSELQDKVLNEIRTSTDHTLGQKLSQILEIISGPLSQDTTRAPLYDELGKLQHAVGALPSQTHLTALQDTLQRCFSVVQEVDSRLVSLSNDQSSVKASITKILSALGDTARLDHLGESLADFRHLLENLPTREDVETWKVGNQKLANIELEKDALQKDSGRLNMEVERLAGRIRAQEEINRSLSEDLKSSQAEISKRDVEIKALYSRNSELEIKLSTALGRIGELESTSKDAENKARELEAAKHEYLAQSNQWRGKFETLQLQSEWLQKDKEARERELKKLALEHEQLISQQNRWDEMRRTAEQVELIAERIRESELRDRDELQSARDRIKATEGENIGLQKRIREQDTKLSNVERASMTARQNLAQAQQRASDWEKRAKDFESALEKTSSTVTQLEDTRLQLEAEVLATQARADDRESEHQHCMGQLRDQIQNLTTDLGKIRGELADTKKAAHVSAWRAQVPKGASTPVSHNGLINERSKTPTLRSRQVSELGDIQNTSTWDSMHAPSQRPRQPYQVVDRSISVSPTPSVVSNAPTLQEDGWWS